MRLLLFVVITIRGLLDIRVLIVVRELLIVTILLKVRKVYLILVILLDRVSIDIIFITSLVGDSF